MDESRILSGSVLVAKGATKKIDGQLPQLGLKEVSANGSWLEQKQIQSALEARKQLIAVERIEKSSSLSHAEWRDDLKLAEVTKQTGGHWQYIGHNKGKHLYLLPEEALFLIEINSLLLKHNGVTVSLQKAYSLCLTEMPLIQYKVYASLSRLGYRVLRHKEPKPEESHNHKIKEECKEVTNVTAIDKSPQKSSLCIDEENHLHESIANDAGHQSTNDIEHEKNENNEITDVQMKDKCEMVTEPSEDVSISAVSVTVTTDDKMEVIVNNVTLSTIEVLTKISTEKEIVQNGSTPHTEKTDNINESDTINKPLIAKTKSLDENNIPDKSPDQNEDKSTIGATLVSNSENFTDNITAASKIDEDYNSEKLVIVCSNALSVIKQERVVNSPSTINSDVVYSIDEVGVIREGEKLVSLNCDGPVNFTESNVPTDTTDDSSKTKDTGSNETSKQYEEQINHYDEKIKKISKRKASTDQTNNHEVLDTLQDFYKERIVNVDVPEEKYLPRNIFLHRTAYRLNMDVIRNQNASNVSSDEMDSIESPSRTPNVPTSQTHTYPPQYGNFNANILPRYPNRPERPQYYIFKPPMQNYYGPRWRLSNDFTRQQYMAYQENRRDAMKTYHYNTIVNIVTRFKNGFIATPSQTRALHSLLNTYNLRYNANIGITHDYNIINTKYQPQPQQTAENIIVLDEEPKRKKPRLNDESEKTKSNLSKLKELAEKLKDLHSKNLATPRHRRVFSNALKTYNKSFKADLYLDSNFEIVDRKLVVLDSSSDSEAVVAKEKEKPRKKKKLRNPYSILKHATKDQNSCPSTSVQVPVFQTPSPNTINEETSPNERPNTTLITIDNNAEGLLKYFDKAWLPSDDDFGSAELCSKKKAQLDALLFQADYLHDVLKETADFESWKDIKLSVLKEIRVSLDIQKQQAEALSNDFFMETESQIQPIIGKGCTDLKSALKMLAIIPTNKDIPTDTSLRIDFDVCNRDVPFKKTNPPKPNFRVVCYDESAVFPPSGDVAALQAKYVDGVPIVFAFVGISASVSYLQIKPIELPVFMPDELT